VTLTVWDRQNRTLARNAFTLGDFFGRNGFGASNGEDLPVIDAAVASGEDFDIEILVERPSPRSRDRMRIDASATTNDLGRNATE
jgi:hypothetical protein